MISHGDRGCPLARYIARLVIGNASTTAALLSARDKKRPTLLAGAALKGMDYRWMSARSGHSSPHVNCVLIAAGNTHPMHDAENVDSHGAIVLPLWASRIQSSPILFPLLKQLFHKVYFEKAWPSSISRFRRESDCEKLGS